jgi:hypothetical protein
MNVASAAADRREVWRGADLLEALAQAGRWPARYRMWSALEPAFDLDDAVSASSWPARHAADLPAFLRCIGAAAHSAAWRSIIDGEQLRRLAEVISEPLLDAVLALDPLLVPALPGGEPDMVSEQSLHDLGRHLLLGALPGSIGRADTVDPGLAHVAVDAGAALFAAFRPEHA